MLIYQSRLLILGTPHRKGGLSLFPIAQLLLWHPELPPLFQRRNRPEGDTPNRHPGKGLKMMRKGMWISV